MGSGLQLISCYLRKNITVYLCDEHGITLLFLVDLCWCSMPVWLVMAIPFLGSNQLVASSPYHVMPQKYLKNRSFDVQQRQNWSPMPLPLAYFELQISPTCQFIDDLLLLSSSLILDVLPGHWGDRMLCQSHTVSQFFLHLYRIWPPFQFSFLEVIYRVLWQATSFQQIDLKFKAEPTVLSFSCIKALGPVSDSHW